MSRVSGFPPVVERSARILILGSMPGRASLEAGQYYALPQNAFWRIMGDLFGAGLDLPYTARLKKIVENRVEERCEEKRWVPINSRAKNVSRGSLPQYLPNKLFESPTNIVSIRKVLTNRRRHVVALEREYSPESSISPNSKGNKPIERPNFIQRRMIARYDSLCSGDSIRVDLVHDR